MIQIDDFITNFSKLLEETNASELSGSTNFIKLEEWSSLVGMATLNMIMRKYDVRLTYAHLNDNPTIEQLVHLINQLQK